MAGTRTNCELDHARPAKAVVRVQVKSSRVGSAGRAMLRDLVLCAAHAKELRRMGIDLVQP